MTAQPLTEYLIWAIQNGFNVLIKGKPGIGKTDIVKDATQLALAKLILSHPVVNDPTDYKGFPYPDKCGDYAKFLPFGDLYELINATSLTVFFIDDIGQAVPTVQAALMQLIWGGKINGHEVSPFVRFIGATNRKEDKAAVTGLIEPVKSRFASIIELEVSTDDWVRWALLNDMPVDLIAFIRFRPELLDNFQPTKDIVNSTSPRTVANVGRQQNAGLKEELYFEVFKGAAGEAFSTEYTSFLAMKKNMPNVDSIILNPTQAAIPNEPGILYALSGALAHRMKDNNIDAISTYLERLPGEIAVCCMKDAITKNSDLKNTKGFIKFATGKVGSLIL